MIQRHDLDVALSFAELDSLRLVASGSTRSIPVNHQELLLSLRLVRRHNMFFPLILTEAGRRRLRDEDARMEQEPSGPAPDRGTFTDSPETGAQGPLLLQSRCRYVGSPAFCRLPRR